MIKPEPLEKTIPEIVPAIRWWAKYRRGYVLPLLVVSKIYRNRKTLLGIMKTLLGRILCV